MINEGVRQYLLHGLGATPVVLTRLLEGVPQELWDRRPDPERFTLREVLAHLADWESIWFRRVERISSEENPLLSGYDPEKLAEERHYARSDVQATRRRFNKGRAALLERLEALQLPQWERIGRHEELGPMSLQDLAQTILGHDGYHLRQVAEWIGQDPTLGPRPHR